MVALAFPIPSIPGARPGEGAGRLLNVYAFQEGDSVVYAPAPGLVPFADVGERPRGMLAVASLLYAAAEDGLYSVASDGTVTRVGNLVGDELVTMARNNRPAPDVVVVTDTGAYVVSGGVVAGYPDEDVGSPRSVCFLDGYLLFTYGDGTSRATGLNTTDLNSLSSAKAEAKPDGALRGIVKGRQYIVLGTSSTEFNSNVGTSPYPLARDEVVDVGLRGRWAVAGFEDGWDGPLIMVAADGTVRRWDGYTATKISTRDVERDIARVDDPETLVACVYTFGGNSVWSLSGPGFTWDYYGNSGAWYERESRGLHRWRGRTSARVFGRWLVGDSLSPSLMAIHENARTEGDQPLVCSAEGLGPSNGRLGDLHLYFSTGQGRADADGTPERTPAVMIDWSYDGGGRYGTKLHRSLGEQGEYRRVVRVSSLGTAREQPIVVRWTVSDPVPFQFRGGEILRASGRRA